MALVKRTSIARTHRSAMTLIELLVAAAITSVVAAAAATLLSAASNASSQSRNVRTINSAGYYAEGRIGATVRQARAIGEVKSDKVGLWVADANDDDNIQLSETGVIYYDGDANAIYFLQTDSTATGAATTAVAATDLLVADKLDGLIREAGSTPVQWAEDVHACTFDGYPSLSDTRVVTASFTIGSGNDATDFAVTASPKAPADYLFISRTRIAPSGTETRYRRGKVSPYSGVSTAD